MSLLRNNQEVYGTVEFAAWANRSDLDAAERFVLSRYLERERSTLEAGTGGGRILFALKAMGFASLAGFDFVPAFVEEARRKDSAGAIRFEVADATKLPYADASVEQIVYLQQIVSLVESAARRQLVMTESFRILKAGGTALFSFLSYEVRANGLAYRLFLTYLRGLRLLSGSRRSVQSLPWLKLGGRPNFGALLDREPHVYWFKAAEAVALLEQAGFHLRAIGTEHQMRSGRMCGSAAELCGETMDGGLYCVCGK